MKEGLKIYKVDFVPVYPTGGCLILAAYDTEQAEELAAKTITHTDKFSIEELIINEPKVIEYISGDY